MTTPHACHAAVASAALFAALLATAGPAAATGTKAEHNAVKERIAAEYKADREVCKSFSGNKKEVCDDQAQGREKVARAEAEYNQTGKASDRAKIAVAKAHADLEVAEAKCGDKLGREISLCKAEAKAAHTKAITDAR